jgi:hypothetical protein
MESVTNEFTTVKQDVQEIKNLDLSNINAPLVKEMQDARGTYSSINDRLNSMAAYDILHILERLTTNRTYEYNSDGNISKEIVRGDLSYDVIYLYDTNNNIRREERYDVNGVLIGYKDYTYDDLGQIKGVSGENADDVSIATNTLDIDELKKRMSAIESIDFIKLAGDLKGTNVESLLKSIQDILIRIQTLELYLPGNESKLIEIGGVLDRLDAIERRLNTNYVTYTFDVTSDVTEYTLPDNITSNFAIYLEGVLLDSGDDYIIDNGKIKFLIPLIDGFTVTCRY